MRSSARVCAFASAYGRQERASAARVFYSVVARAAGLTNCRADDRRYAEVIRGCAMTRAEKYARDA